MTRNVRLIICRQPRGRLLDTLAGPTVLTCEPLGAEEIQFRPQLAERPTRRGRTTHACARCDMSPNVAPMTHSTSRLTARAFTRTNRRMSTTLRITGAIDRREPDPQAPGDPVSTWIGNVQISWVDDMPRTAAAALIQVCTGRGSGDVAWGKYVLQLRWIGDPPPVQIADTVYDYVRDGGPSRRPISRTLVSQPRSEAQPSYRVAMAGAA